MGAVGVEPFDDVAQVILAAEKDRQDANLCELVVGDEIEDCLVLRDAAESGHDVLAERPLMRDGAEPHHGVFDDPHSTVGPIKSFHDPVSKIAVTLDEVVVDAREVRGDGP